MTADRKTFDTIVTVCSWEPRFLLGMRRTLRECSAKTILAYFLGEYGDRTKEAREGLRELVREQRSSLVLKEREMTFATPTAAWELLRRDVGPESAFGNALVDLTTMPREIIWSTLFWLGAAGAERHYVYNRPESYAKDWLARDPNDPRLVYKLAGLLDVGRPTALGAVTGFDENRCRQAVEFYEPTRVVLAAQGGRQYENNVRNVGPKFAADGIPIEHTLVNAYGEDHGHGVLRGFVEKLAKSHNVILCSFGPKPSAIALYRLQREFPQCALAYIGCKEYNREYSAGLGPPLWGRLARQEDSE